MNDVLAATVPTPVGDLAVLVHDDVVVAAGFAPYAAHFSRLRLDADLRPVRDLGAFTAAVSAYVDGDLRALDALPVHQPGGPFRQAVWKVLRDVDPGTTISYAELAARAGSPLAARAAGSACADNLIAPIVPCHRIVRSGVGGRTGGLGGYYYGLSTKEWLLAHEREHATVRVG
ncbi:MAG TPA: methylated-DNA--[protein]-cysteine S-methyltransferase [Mycobacteriales bacterium]|nr:methylated-DNA--[protein]-cysteine S-methyltransferase [Mycobacteriales bacterium]